MLINEMRKPADDAGLGEEFKELRERLDPVAQIEPSGLDRALRRAAVLVPILETPEGASLLLTRRTDSVETHKGQISFPGGAAEGLEPFPVGTALRESEEEVGVPPLAIHPWGLLNAQESIAGFWVVPVVGEVRWQGPWRLSEGEVTHLLFVPLSWLADDGHREMRPVRRPDGRVQSVLFFAPFHGDVIWGLTASIIADLLERIKSAK
jgi:8-oxo-dGTP pyrophosphatase MutT (NUDIX family)